MTELIEFFTIQRIVLLAAWLWFTVSYYRSYNRHKTDFYNGLRGSDNTWQPIEIAAWYWIKFMPIVSFMILLMAICGLLGEELTEELLLWLVGAITTIFMTAIAGKTFAQNGKKNQTQEGESKPQDRGDLG